MTTHLHHPHHPLATPVRRPGRTVLAGLLATAAVAGGLAAAAPPAASRAGTVAGTTDVVVRPDGDVSAFGLPADAPSAASVLDEAVRRPAPVPAGDAILAAGRGDTTTVLLGGSVRSTLRPAGARAWFFAGAGGGTSLRVEVVSKKGAVLAGTVVEPGQGMRWTSLRFPATSRAALKGLRMRFIAVGGEDAEVRAAYASVAAESGPAAVLRPRRDLGGLTVQPSGTAAAALDDAVDRPGAPSYDERLQAAPGGRSTTVGLADAGGAAERVRVSYHARTGSGTRLRVEAVSGGQVRAATTLPARSRAGWRGLAVPVTSRQAVDDLQLRFTTVGGEHAEVAAASATVTLTEEPFSAYLDRYAGTLPSLTAGAAEPAKATGPGVQTVSEPLADLDAPSGESRFRCVTTPVRAKSNPHKIVALDPDGNKMWLGALLQGTAYAGGPGSLADLPTTGERAPIKIWTDLMGADIKRDVDDPDGAEVQQAIADMVREAKASGVQPPAQIAYEQTSQSSVEDGLIDAGISVRYMGGNGAAELRSQRHAQRSSLLVSLTQRSFTVNLVRPNRFSDYFDHRFTRDDLGAMQEAGQIGPDNPPVVISNIAYGRVLFYSVSSTATQEELEGAIRASYDAGAGGGSGEVTARQQAILNQAELKVFAMGGPTAGVENLIRSHDIQDYFAADNPLDLAVPISYQVDNLDGSPASFTETTDYDLRTCEAIANTAVDVGDVIRVEKPRFYLDADRADAEMYGSLTIDGVEFWNRHRDTPQLIQNHVLTNPTSSDQAVDGRVQWPMEVTLDNATNPLSRVQGSVNCRLWFGDGSNQYDWRYDSRTSQPGSVVVHGGSRTCGTQLRFQVTKVRDVWHYQP